MAHSLLLAGVILASLACQLASAQSSVPAQTTLMDSVLVFGAGFVFSLKEPEGWHCVCDETHDYVAYVIPGHKPGSPSWFR